MCYIGYRDLIKNDGKYEVNNKWVETIYNPNTKKWILLATNLKKHNDIFVIKNSK